MLLQSSQGYIMVQVGVKGVALRGCANDNGLDRLVGGSNNVNGCV